MNDKKEYFLIGEVSKRCNIPIKTLRYYDEIGLLKPKKIDNTNNYRYYSKRQILYISIIKDLKESDFSLEHIKKLMKRDDLSGLKLNLKHRLQEISKEISELNYIEMKLRVYLEGIDKGLSGGRWSVAASFWDI